LGTDFCVEKDCTKMMQKHCGNWKLQALAGYDVRDRRKKTAYYSACKPCVNSYIWGTKKRKGVKVPTYILFLGRMQSPCSL
jgi:hypothetical protein